MSLLRKIRERHRLTQVELSEMLDISQVRVSQIELGTEGMSPKVIASIRRVFGKAFEEDIAEYEAIQEYRKEIIQKVKECTPAQLQRVDKILSAKV